MIELNPEEIRQLYEKWADEYEDVVMTDAEWDMKRSLLLCQAQINKLTSMTPEDIEKSITIILEELVAQVHNVTMAQHKGFLTKLIRGCIRDFINSHEIILNKENSESLVKRLISRLNPIDREEKE